MEFSIIFLAFQIIWGFFILRRINRGVYLQDIRVFFLIVYSLYSLSFPLVCYFELVNYFNLNIVGYVTLQYGLALFAFNLVNLLYKVKFNNSSRLEQIPIKNSSILFAILFGFLIFQLIHMMTAGISIFKFGEGMSDRVDVGKAVNQIWVIVSFLIIGLFDFLLYNFANLSKNKKFILILSLLIYIVFQASIGNRREYAGIIFFIICFYLITKHISLKPKIIIVISVLFAASFYLSMSRDENTRDLKGDKAVELMLASNEFVYPMQTTYYIMRDNWELRYGLTYTLLPFQIMIPRELYPEKPSTLGAEFVEKTFGRGGMGYAYTPISEAYLNFGVIGPFLIFALVAVLFNFIVKRQYHEFKFYYFILYGLIFDFCRGDVASIIYAFVCIYCLGYNSYKFITKIRY